MYRVDGSSDLVEETLDHFEGWRGSKPVRIGNGAADQLQLDIYGEASRAVYAGDGYGLPIAYQGWLALTKIMDWVADNWDQPDEGVSAAGTSPTAGSSAGWPWTAPSSWRSAMAGPLTPPSGRRPATGSTPRS
jgi:hypothetical protein